MARAAPDRATAAEATTRVLIVDDSAVARSVLGRMVERDRRFAVAATVADADAALAYLARERVDVILLDLEMPGVDGLTALPDLIAAGDGARVLVVSSSCDEGAATSVQALALGAADTLLKPGTSVIAGRFSDTLTEKLARLAAAAVAVPPPAPAATEVARAAYDVVAVGASTGGIHALGQLLRAIPCDFTTPIVVTQHLPVSVSGFFAAQVAVLANRPCDVATDRLRIRPGRVIVAPGDAHVTCVALGDGTCAVRLTTERAASGCLPSVDPMLASFAEVYGARLLAVMLSGMGRDGMIGAGRVRHAGGTMVVQDRASSVVWGMPGAVAGAGLAQAEMTPDAIGRFIAGGRRLP